MPEAFCGLETVRQKTPWTLCALWEKKLRSESICLFILFRGYFSFSQIYTEEQNTQGFTETLSQLITQNLTAIFSWNALWILYAEGLLWVRNSAPKGSVKSVSSVRERDTLRERKKYPLWEKNLPTPHTSSLIGVTSHITPLSIRRGAGGEAAVSSVREKLPCVR